MKPFLQNVAEALLARHGGALRAVAVVLPSKRAGLYLRKYLAASHHRALWSPEFFTFPELLERLSGLHVAAPVVQLIELHRCIENEGREVFSEMLNWAPAALRDMSEVDSHGLDPGLFYRDLRSIEELENWSLRNDELSAGQRRLLDYWQRMGRLHPALNERLQARGLGTTGHVERSALAACGTRAFDTTWEQVWFAGLNALTPAQEGVLAHFAGAGRAVLAWDADAYYTGDPEHEAGHHLRHLMARYGPGIIPLSDGLCSPERAVEVIEVPEHVTQCWHVASLIAGMAPEDRERTAVLLADESLLQPLLRALPGEIGTVNVTMGVPLRTLPVASLVDAIIAIHEHSRPDGLAMDDLEHLLAHPFVQDPRTGDPRALLDALRASRSPRIPLATILRAIEEHCLEQRRLLTAILTPATQVEQLIDRTRSALEWARERNGTDVFVNEQLFQAAEVLHHTSEAIKEHVVDLASFSKLFNVLARNQRIGFFGEPLQGLQIMGMLESRSIDHERIIVIGAQEGTLPPDGDHGGYIPHDIRRYHGLPLRQDNDAVASYSFHRALHHARHVTLVHAGGEEGSGPSRFIAQLTHELAPASRTRVKHSKVGVRGSPRAAGRYVLERTPEVNARLKARLMERGLSPTALSTWLRCPLDHWFRHVLGLGSEPIVQDRITEDVIGTVVHGVLRDIYSPWVGTALEPSRLRERLPEVRDRVHAQLSAALPGQHELQGHPLLQAEMATAAIARWIGSEARAIEHNERIRLLGIEQHLEAFIEVDGLRVRVHGHLDRYGTHNEEHRIIDIKTGGVRAGDVRLRTIDPLPADRPIAVQLMCYAWLKLMNEPGLRAVEARAVPLREASRTMGHTLRMNDAATVDRQHLPAIAAAVAGSVRNMLDPSFPIAHEPASVHCRFCNSAR